MLLKAIIVDDEPRARRILRSLLEEYCPNVQVIASVKDVLAGVKAVHQFQPDVVFLDIEMPNYKGFKLLDFFEEINFSIVFTTAYEKYALQAFKMPAEGYLMKPIDIDELISTVRVISEKSGLSESVPIHTHQDIGVEDASGRIVLPTQNGLLYIQTSEITHIQSEGRYTKLFLEKGENVTCTIGLKNFEKVLSNDAFIRVHRSFIINLDFISKYSKGADSFVQLDNTVRIDVGKKYKEALNKALTYFIR